MKAPAWRRALIARLKKGFGDFGGNHPQQDREDAIAWLRGASERSEGRDMKVVVRRRTNSFAYSLCVGMLGYSASDNNAVLTVYEGHDF